MVIAQLPDSDCSAPLIVIAQLPRRVSGALNLAVGFNPRWHGIIFSVASATIEFSRR